MENKLKFLKTELPFLLRRLSGDEKPLWGVMNAQQMIEHMSDSFRQGNGKAPRELHTSLEHIPAYQNFLMSEKEFRPDTKNPTMPAVPPKERNPDIGTAIAELEEEISAFIDHFDKDPGKAVVNPIFGSLNFEGWVQLLYKHARHHLKQFSLLV